MFDQILQLVKEHFANNPEVAGAIPPGQADAIHHEIATHINNGLQNQETSPGGLDTVLSHLEGNFASGNVFTNAISGGLISSLASKFGLSPFVTGAIAGSLPSLIQKFVHKNSATPGTEV